MTAAEKLAAFRAKWTKWHCAEVLLAKVARSAEPPVPYPVIAMALGRGRTAESVRQKLLYEETAERMGHARHPRESIRA